MGAVEDLGKIVLREKQRYMNPDPSRPIAIGQYGRVEKGVFIAAGDVREWMVSRGVAGVEVERMPANIYESSTLHSEEITETTISLSGEVDVPTTAVQANAKFGMEIAFTSDNQYYFHHPECRFVGITKLHDLGESLVRCAKLADHDPQHWNRDYCVVTGVYETAAMLRVFGRKAGQKIGITARGAVTTQDLYKGGAEFGFVSRSDYSVSLRESFSAPAGNCVPYYEIHKVHWDVFGNRWWRGTTNFDPS